MKLLVWDKDNDDRDFVHEFDFNIRYVRPTSAIRNEEDDRNIYFKSSRGGITIVDFDTPNRAHRVQYAKCRDDEYFHKRAGVAVCISKFIRRVFDRNVVDIIGPDNDFKDEYTVRMGPKTNDMYWFLNAFKWDHTKEVDAITNVGSKGIK